MSNYNYKPPFIDNPYLWKNEGYYYILMDGVKYTLGKWHYNASNQPVVDYLGGQWTVTVETATKTSVTIYNNADGSTPAMWLTSSEGPFTWGTNYGSTTPRIRLDNSHYVGLPSCSCSHPGGDTSRYFFGWGSGMIYKTSSGGATYTASVGGADEMHAWNVIDLEWQINIMSALCYNPDNDRFALFYSKVFPLAEGDEDDYYDIHTYHSWDLVNWGATEIKPTSEEFLVSVYSEVEYNDEATADAGGGWGSQEVKSDKIDLPTLPTLSMIDTGMVSMYKCTQTELNSLAAYLWSDDFSTNITKITQNPMEAIISLSLCPLSSSITDTTSAYIKIGNVNSEVVSTKINNHWLRLDFGSIDVQLFWGTALDYNPNTKIEIYLPFIGIQTLDIDDVMGGRIHLYYDIDLLSGVCVALLTTQRQFLDSVLYHWRSSINAQVPLTASDMTDKIRALSQFAMQAGGAVATGLATGGASLATSALSLASSAPNVLMAKTHIQRASSIGDTAGFLSVKTPYLIITRAVRSQPANIRHLKGLPCNITATLGDLNGFTIVDKINIENIVATEKEISEIENLLKTGVIL